MKNLLIRSISLGVLLVVAAAPAQADYNDGVKAAQKQDFGKALSEFRPLAEQGHAGAQ